MAAMELLKTYWKETLLAAIMTIVLGFLVDVIPNMLIPKEMIQPAVVSTELMIIGLLVMVALFTVPIISAALAGYLISKKTREIIPTLALPAVGAAIGGIVLMAVPALLLFTLDDAGWQSQLDEVKNAAGGGIGFFSSMGAQEFRAITIGSMAIGLVFMGAIDLSFGLLGAFLGRFLALRQT